MKTKEQIHKDKLFFTSDTHWHHENIIKFCNRPWGDIRTHDSALIQNWNSVVPVSGVVFHLGDFAMTARIDYIKELVEQLNGTIYLVMGNHDYRNRFDREAIVKIFGGRVFDAVELTIVDEERTNNHTNFHCTHHPLMFWNRGSYHLHGHVHGGPETTASERVPFHFMRHDVGVDNNGYTPISYNVLMDTFLSKFLNNE